MKTKKNDDRIELPDFSCRADAEETVGFIVDEEDPPCAEYVVVSEQPNMPALQEYLHDLHSDAAGSFS